MSNSKSLVVVESPSRPIGRKRPLLVLAPLAITSLAGLLVFLLYWAKPTGDVGAAAINVGPVIVAEPWNATPLPIQLGPPEAVPKGAWIQIDGLPLVTALSEGHVMRPGSWNVPLSRLPMLKITASPTQGPMPKVAIALMSADGVVLAEAHSLLAVMPDWVVRSCPAALAGPTSGGTGQLTTMSISRALVDPAPAWVSTEARQDVKDLMRKGDHALSEGNIQIARAHFERAATEKRWPAAALAAAWTFDPEELSQHAPSVAPDPEKARLWYAQAKHLWNTRVDFYLQRLGPPKASGAAFP